MVNQKKALEQHLSQASEWRSAIERGVEPSEAEINRLTVEWKEVRPLVAPFEKDELLGLVDPYGRPNSLAAPRWLCHFLGLRHPTVHVLLTWESPKSGPVYVLQIRSWNKKDYPGHLDISAGGHIGLADVHDPIAVAYREMEEELGLSGPDLIDHKLNYAFGYENYAEDPIHHFYNREWNVVFMGTLKIRSLESIYFKDGEVAGLYLCPESAMEGLYRQSVLPCAMALDSYLRHLYKV